VTWRAELAAIFLSWFDRNVIITRTARSWTGCGADLVPVPAHPQPLMLTTFLAHAPSDVRGISPVLKTLATRAMSADSSAIDRSASILVNPKPH
jgi:hypothetical protein